MKRILAALMHCASAATLTAQRVDVLASIGVGAARADTISGVVLNATLTARTTWLQLALTPVEFISYSSQRATFIRSDIAGEDVCQNQSIPTGSGRRGCVGTTARFGATGSLAVRLPGTPAFVGYGTRLSADGAHGFGTLSFAAGTPLSVPLRATAQIGSQYVSAVVSVGTRLTRHRP